MSYLALGKRIAAGLAQGSATPAPSAGPSTHLCASDARFCQAVAILTAMPLDLFEAQGSPLEVRVPWWPDTLWFVPTAADAQHLETDGVTRCRIWTARELMHLVNAAPFTGEVLTVLMVVRRDFSGEIVRIQQAGPAS